METITDSININEERRVFFTNQYIINSIHTPFIGYQQQGDQLIIVSEKLNDDHRFLNLGNNFFNKENIAPYFNRAVDELLIWLSQNCWKNNFVHGDLTDDNMILRFGTDGLPHICIIDWFDFGYYHTGDEAIYRILLDIFDVLSTLAMSIGIHWRYVSSEMIKDKLQQIGSLGLNYKGYNIFNLLADEIKKYDEYNNDKYTSYLKDSNGVYLPKIQIILEWANVTLFATSGGSLTRFALKNNTRKKKRNKKKLNKKKLKRKKSKKINTERRNIKRRKQSKKRTMKKK